jgi:membrane associated rhomboid family serine protease
MPSNIGFGAGVLFVLMLGASAIALWVQPKLLGEWALRPYYVARQRNYWSFLTSGFIHADIGHLFFNAITYYFFAFSLERQIGTAKFVVLYFAGLFLSQITSYLKHRNDPQYATLGASGAISAVLFAAVVYNPTQSLIIFPIPLPIPAPLFAVGYLTYTWWAARRVRDRVNHDAHLGGALTGLAFVALTDAGAYSRALQLLN